MQIGERNMKKIRILSAFLAVLMICGVLTVLPVSASIPLAGETSGDKITSIDYKATIENYLNKAQYTTPQEKLASMTMMWQKYGYQLWADEITGEVATVKVSTGEILFSNPWDVSSIKAAKSEKQNLLSQIIINYTDNGTTKTMNSCTDAAMNGQIKIKYIKNGIRVEYSIGRENSKFLVPRVIEKSAFESKILVPMREAVNAEVKILITEKQTYSEVEEPYTTYRDAYDKGLIEIGKSYSYYDLLQYQYPDFDITKSYPDGHAYRYLDHKMVGDVLNRYMLWDPNDPSWSADQIADMQKRYPITKKMSVYVFDEKATTAVLVKTERLIKTYAPAYTVEELDADHLKTEYEGTAQAPALFKLALEYTVDAQGVSVTLPANGIRFDEALYQLDSVTMLPYMGAGTAANGGYNFFPDGSGALFDFEKLNDGKSNSIKAKVYGVDYAYHSITGKYQEVIRYPVFGSIEHWSGKKTVTDYTVVTKEATFDANGNLLTPAEYGTKIVDAENDRGFVAIIEEGDAMAELKTEQLSASNPYAALQMTFYPRPTDTYNMADAISVGENKAWTVVSSRKYVGNYQVRYIILSDDELAEEANLYSYYECSWLGMAEAYRDYLENNGIMKRLTDEDVNENIPLYIESFGAIETVEKFLSVPVNVMVPLTTFADVKTMYNQLSEKIEGEMKDLVENGDSIAITDKNAENFNNINFKLTGFANGGMYSTVPYHLNWEEAVGGAAGFQDLVDYAKKEGFGVFPDFDFAYVTETAMFDGIDINSHAVKTIDNRYTSRRDYDATYQTYIGYYELAISPAYFSRFVTKFTINYMKYNPTGISVSTLGTSLNSDFDEDEPYNREDAKRFTVQALQYISQLSNDDGNNLKVMTNGANAYAWKYVDHILNAPLNSSRYNISSNAVPFIGTVLHGYKQYAGTPINEEGDLDSALLKAIENGSGLFFKLSYDKDRISLLKDDKKLSSNYSVRYDIWEEDVVSMYVELNNLLADLQTKLIIDHDFLIANRIPDADELESDKAILEEAEALKKAAEEAEKAAAALKEALELRKTPGEQSEFVANSLKEASDLAIKAAKAAAKIDGAYVADAVAAVAAAKAAKEAADATAYVVYHDASYAAGLTAASNAVKSHVNSGITEIANAVIAAATEGVTDENAKKAIQDAVNEIAAAVLEAAINAGGQYAIDIATDTESGYLTTEEKAAADIAKAEALIKAVEKAAREAGNALVAATEDADLKAISRTAVSQMVSKISVSLTIFKAQDVITKGGSAYASAKTTALKTVNTITTVINNKITAINTAYGKGVTSDKLYDAYYDSALANEASKLTAKDSAFAKVYGNETDPAKLAELDAQIADAAEKIRNGENVTANSNIKTAANALVAYECAAAMLADAEAMKSATYVKDYYKNLYNNAEATYNAALAAYQATGGTTLQVTNGVRAINAVSSAQAQYDKALLAYQEALAEYESPIGRTDEDEANLKRTKTVLDNATAILEKAKNDVEKLSLVDEYKAAVEAFIARSSANDQKKAADDAVKYMLEEAQYVALNGKDSAVIKAAEAAVESATLEAEFKSYSDTLSVQVTNLTTVYGQVVALIESGEKAVDIAEKAVADLLLKLEATRANAEATDRELARAEQFYQIGVEELTKAKADLAAIVAIAETIKNDYVNSEDVLNINVTVFGSSVLDTNFSSAVQGSDKFASDIAGDSASNPVKLPLFDIIANYKQAKADYAEAKADYEAAKAAYDAIMALDWSSLTEEENSKAKSDLIVYAYRIATAENEMEAAQTAMKDAKTAFTARYASVNVTIKSVSDAQAALLQLLADANAIGDAETAAKVTEALVTVNAIVADMDAVYAEIVAKSLDAGLIDENGEVVKDEVKNDTAAPEEEDEDEEKSEFDVNVTDKYVYDDGSVLAVTYGGKDGDDEAAYRTFILNYNAFAVTVVYNDVEYTVGGYGYVVINH